VSGTPRRQEISQTVAPVGCAPPASIPKSRPLARTGWVLVDPFVV